MPGYLPTNLGAWTISGISCRASICSSNQKSRHCVNAILQTLSSLEDPIERRRYIFRERRFDVGVNISTDAEGVSRMSACVPPSALPRFLETLRSLRQSYAVYLGGLNCRRSPSLVLAVQGDLKFVGLKMTRLGTAVILALAWAVSVGAQSTLSNPPGTPPPSNQPAGNSSDSLNLPKGTGIVGTLSTNLDTKHSKVGDRVEVEVTQNVKPGGHILLRSGSHVTGQITQAYAFSKKEDSNAKLEIVFNNVVSKSGEQIPTYLVIYALAAGSDPTTDDLQDPRGMEATSQRAGAAGGLGRPANGVLQPDSKGIFGLDGLILVPMARDKPPTSLVRSERQDVRLKKGTEIVLVVVSQ